ncbi:hypothetical protein BRW84_03010 [Oxalobacter formigenes OXCC13]|nr:hypothetical protein BRW84_03010 [Oxalobacter formigenes OXCC13]
MFYEVFRRSGYFQGAVFLNSNPEIGRFVHQTDITKTKVRPRETWSYILFKNMTFMMASHELPEAILKRAMDFARREKLKTN